MSELLDVAETLARRAGEHALKGRRAHRGEGLGALTKSTPTDIVTRYDRECETIIVEGLTDARPHDAIVGEEGSARPGTSGIEWHIDPIDGTANFFFDLPAWSVSVGARDAEGPLVGAVYLPVLDEMFAAERGRGATMNGRPIAPRNTTELGQALLGTGFSYDPVARERHGRTVSRMVSRVRDIRRLGAASVDMCFVACGRLDAYLESGLHSWDVTAARVVLTEAGCTVSDLHGGPACDTEVIAASPGLHASIVSLYADAVGGDA
jgi:myo-inositol-1(or 4)-monophosphatase